MCPFNEHYVSERPYVSYVYYSDMQKKLDDLPGARKYGRLRTKLDGNMAKFTGMQ